MKKIKQTAKEIRNIDGPVKITGTKVTQGGKAVGVVGIEQTIDGKKADK